MSGSTLELSSKMENIGLAILAVAEIASFHSLIKATKKTIEYHELPAMFIVFAYLSDFSRLILGQFRVSVPSMCVITLLLEVIFIIWTIVILIRDNTRKGICTMLWFIFGSVAFLILGFFLMFLYYVYVFFAMLGPIECFIIALKKKKSDILPIFTAIALLICNIFYLIAYIVELETCSLTSVCGIIVTLAQVITYFVLRKKEGEYSPVTTGENVDDPNKPLVYNKMQS